MVCRWPCLLEARLTFWATSIRPRNGPPATRSCKSTWRPQRCVRVETAGAQMKNNKALERARKFPRAYRVTDGKKFRLKDYDPGDTGDMNDEDKPRAQEALQAGVEMLAELQARLYAQDRWAVLLIFQAMDAAGKDSAIKHVMSGINPSGCQVASFKAP